MLAAVTNARGLDWRTWVLGLFRSVIQGGAGAAVGALGPMATDPNDFNVATTGGAHHLVISMMVGFGIAAMVHMFMFLQTHPVPELLEVPDGTAGSRVASVTGGSGITP